MSLSVYEKHAKHFQLVRAYCVINVQGEHIGNITFKYPKNGYGKLFGYLQLFGSQIENTWVAGCGYDKLSTCVNKLADEYLVTNKENLTENQVDFLLNLKENHFNSNKDFNGFKIFQVL